MPASRRCRKITTEFPPVVSSHTDHIFLLHGWQLTTIYKAEGGTTMTPVKELMSSEVDTISPDANADDAASKMKSLDVGAIPVCDGKKLVGMLTDRDLVTRVMVERRNPMTTPVREAMTLEVLYCYEDDAAEKAAKLMADKQIRRLPILSKTGMRQAPRRVRTTRLGKSVTGRNRKGGGAARSRAS
jgi:predicted transcriptional regulator